MYIYVVTIRDIKFEEKYRNFCYTNETFKKDNVKEDLMSHFDDMSDYLTEDDEKEIDKVLKKISKPANVGIVTRLKGMGIEITCRKELLSEH